jgi:hypothetical protein
MLRNVGIAMDCALDCTLVSRFRRLYPFAARAFTNVGTKGTLALKFQEVVHSAQTVKR